MNLPEIVREVSARSGIRQEDVSKIIKITFDVIRDSVLKGKAVSINMFGKFLINGPKKRIFRDPRTGERVERMHSRMVFMPSMSIRNLLKQ